MDKNEALKIMEGLKAIKKHCEKFNRCTECEFNNDSICILENLGRTPDRYWNLEELEYKLNKAIETEEQQHEAAQQDMIHTPGHYNWKGEECIYLIRILCRGEDGFDGYCKGNILKYIFREKKKNGLEDLKKARVYLDLLINYRQGKEAVAKSKKGGLSNA